MTPADFKTLRERLGLSAEAFGHLLDRPVRDRTVRYWEAGGIPLPSDAVAALTALDAQAEHHAQQALAVLAQAIAAQGGPPEAVHLIRYAEAEDLRAVDPESARIGVSYHSAVVGRVREALVRAGCKVVIVWFDASAYAHWRRAMKLPDTSVSRAAWAGQNEPQTTH